MPRKADPTLDRAKVARAVTLRNLGLTYQQIADSLWACDQHQPDGRDGCRACTRLYSDRSNAHRAIAAELANRYGEGLAARDELRQLTLSQLDALLKAAMRHALDPASPQQAVMILRANQLLGQRAKLEGLYAPIRVEGVLTTGWEAEVAELAAQIGDLKGKQPASHPG